MVRELLLPEGVEADPVELLLGLNVFVSTAEVRGLKDSLPVRGSGLSLRWTKLFSNTFSPSIITGPVIGPYLS